MTRDEFLRQLQEALENDLQGSIVQENVDYYNQYISEEVRKGVAEQDVIDTLGDPWILAKTVIGSESETKYSNNIYEAEESHSKHNKQNEQSAVPNKAYIFGLDTWWKKLLAVLAIVGILIFVLVIVGGLLWLFLPILIPIIVAIWLLRLWNKR